MTQVIVFFGWLIIGISVTLVVFGHVSILFVYGFDRLMEDIFPSEGVSSLIWSLGAFIPGSIMLGVGKLMQAYDRRTLAHEGDEEPEHTDEYGEKP